MLLIVFFLFFQNEGHPPKFVTSVELHFEPKDGGFFLKAPLQGSTSTAASSAEDISPSLGPLGEGDREFGGIYDPTVLNTEHFTVLPSSQQQPVSIRVNYGPFSTKQTVPIRLLVPDPLDNGLGGPFGNSSLGGTGEPELIPPLDLSAHIVTPTVPKDTPILRVLFHAGQTAFGLPLTQSQSPQRSGSGGRQQVSIFSFLSYIPCIFSCQSQIKYL